MENENVKSVPSRQYWSFGLVLYPEDDSQMRILRFFLRFPRQYRLVYILHDRDVYLQRQYDSWLADPSHDGQPPSWSVGDPEKPHYHLLVKLTSRRTEKSFSNFLGGVHVEGISNFDAQLAYLLHATLADEDKFQYDISDLYGDPDLIARLSNDDPFVRAAHEIMCRITDGMSYPAIFEWILDSISDGYMKNVYIHTLSKYSHYINTHYKDNSFQNNLKKNQKNP